MTVNKYLQKLLSLHGIDDALNKIYIGGGDIDMENYKSEVGERANNLFKIIKEKENILTPSGIYLRDTSTSSSSDDDDKISVASEISSGSDGDDDIEAVIAAVTAINDTDDELSVTSDASDVSDVSYSSVDDDDIDAVIAAVTAIDNDDADIVPPIVSSRSSVKSVTPGLTITTGSSPGPPSGNPIELFTTTLLSTIKSGFIQKQKPKVVVPNMKQISNGIDPSYGGGFIMFGPDIKMNTIYHTGYNKDRKLLSKWIPKINTSTDIQKVTFEKGIDIDYIIELVKDNILTF